MLLRVIPLTIHILSAVEAAITNEDVSELF